MSGEGNQVKWVGVRPVSPVENIQIHKGIFETTVAGVIRTHIAKSAEADVATVVVHTVTAAKIFYLCGFRISCDSGVGKVSHLSVRNVADTVQYELGCAVTTAQTSLTGSLNVDPPIPIAAGFDIAIITTASHASAFIHGWEQDA
jgi:hypothetical protein